jgi:plasmid maintenance system antidote protein VapI
MSVVAAAVKTDIPFVALTEDHLANPDYAPGNLLDALIARMQLKNDAALARVLLLPPPVISKIRRKQVGITPAIMVRIHDITGLSISEIRGHMGVKSQFALYVAK